MSVAISAARLNYQMSETPTGVCESSLVLTRGLQCHFCKSNKTKQSLLYLLRKEGSTGEHLLPGQRFHNLSGQPVSVYDQPLTKDLSGTSCVSNCDNYLLSCHWALESGSVTFTSLIPTQAGIYASG